jgi:hypothetical protein
MDAETKQPKNGMSACLPQKSCFNGFPTTETKIPGVPKEQRVVKQLNRIFCMSHATHHDTDTNSFRELWVTKKYQSSKSWPDLTCILI